MIEEYEKQKQVRYHKYILKKSKIFQDPKDLKARTQEE